MSQRSRASYALLRFLTDIVLTELALFLSGILLRLFPAFISTTEGASRPGVAVYFLVALIWSAGFLLLSVYIPRNQRAIDEAQGLLVAITLGTLTLAGILFFLAPHISRWQLLIFYGLTTLFVIGSRLLMRLVLKWTDRPRYTRRKVLILGAGETGQEVGRMLLKHRWAGLEPVGYLADGISPESEIEGVPILGQMGEVQQQVQMLGVDEVVVALPPSSYDRFFRLLGNMHDLPAQVRIVPDHVKTSLFRSTIEEFAGVPMITLQKPALTPFERQIKRLFDLVVGSLTLALISPLFAIVAVAIRLDSPGPIIYKQQRVGENGKLFWMYKFRSMVKDADKQQSKAIRVRADGQILYKHPDDPRITRVGRFIRRTSLDEFPQLINVIKGEMSLVGPRPELPWLVEKYERWQWQRFAVPQGITGWWQVNGRSDKPMHLYTEEDLYYIQNYSLLLDIRILWRTVGAVAKSEGAF
jgi:exopolysaccharide biosynthesis polyprenyl glycosylphosphotransferase